MDAERERVGYAPRAQVVASQAGEFGLSIT